VLRRHGIPYWCNRAGAMFSIFFTDEAVTDLQTAQKSDRTFFTKYFAAMLDRGVYFAPSPFESNFISAAHTAVETDRSIAAADASLTAVLATA